MDLLDNSKYICNCCQTHLLGQERLVAPNPFDATDLVIGCPKCKTVNDFILICDEPDCWEYQSCGTPVTGGPYRSVCGQHYRELQKAQDESVNK